MNLPVILSQSAVESYEAILSQIRARWGENTVKRFERKTVKTLELLSASPQIFKATELGPHIRKGLINKNCSFFYEIQETRIEILFFWDNRQEPLGF